MKTLLFILFVFTFITGHISVAQTGGLKNDNRAEINVNDRNDEIEVKVPAHTEITGTTFYFIKFDDGSDRDYYSIIIDGEVWDAPLLVHTYKINSYKYYPEYTASTTKPFNPREYLGPKK